VWLVRRCDEASPLVQRFAALLEGEARQAQALRAMAVDAHSRG
jgi:hypothetical protein